MSFTRKPYATPFGAATFTEVLILHRHNLIEQERGGFAITFYVRVKRKQQTAYAATLSVPCGVLFRAWLPLTF